LEYYLSDGSRLLDNLKKFQLVEDVFLKYNTGIPSSAIVEQLSVLVDVDRMTPRNNNFTDEHFEMQLLITANKDFL